MYDMSDHIQSKLIHLQWKIGTYQSHIKYIQGQIRLTHRLIHLVIILLNFHFQKCRDPNPRLDPVGESKPEPGLLRHFQLSSQNILFGFIKFFVFKSVATRIPDSTQLANPSRSLVYSDISNYLLKTCCLCYSILDFLITRKHFNLGKPINIYKIMPLYPHILMLFIFACFHFTNHLSYHNIHFQRNNSIHNSIYEI